ncbi:hypothetical protein O181_064396 [Austropuccinia psidii MF-1]|uniref:Uncharacterized protein n=1 Tax=Austropuccinia psidii MF-1 TaxID=1389203 RepID=A0A9Q3I087_9BASI|nr:hypothetical protein [Austropuccinia psidii MF-1]
MIISRDRVEDTISHDEFDHPHIHKKQAKKVQLDDETMETALNQLKELNRKIKEQQKPKIQDQEEKNEMKNLIHKIKELTEAVLRPNKTRQIFKHENKIRCPKDNLPPFSQSHIPYTPAPNIPKPYVKAYYCLQEGYSVNKCNYLFEDQNKKWVRRQGGGFLFSNWKRVPADGKTFPKKLAEEFEKEQELTKKGRKMKLKNHYPNQSK